MVRNRKFWLVPSVAGSVLTVAVNVAPVAVNVAPEEAFSNLSKWAEFFGFSEMAGWLAGDWADTWVFVICATIVLFSVTMLFQPHIVRAGHSIRSYPIKWGFSGFLGASWRQGEAVYVSVFQIIGKNIGLSMTEILDAKIRSLLTGQEIDVTFKTNGGYTKAEYVNPISRGAKFNCHALFYDPALRKPDEREGLSEDEFLATWGEFEFYVKTRKGRYCRKFSSKEIRDQIARVRPQSLGARRISRRDKGGE